MDSNESLPFVVIGHWNSEILRLGELHHSLLFSLRSISDAEFAAQTTFLHEQAIMRDLKSLSLAVARLKYFRSFGIRTINIGGTMGCGKSTIAEYLQTELHFTFKDADYFHTPQARQKMAAGDPLTDADRFPFLRDAREWLTRSHCGTTCSALRDLHRAILCGLDPHILLDSNDSQRQDPWSISSPNLGLLLILLSKPYEIALQEFDASACSGRTRQFDGKPHFIQVTSSSESESENAGKTPLLRSQYELLWSTPPLPWDALCIDVTTLRSIDHSYQCHPALSALLSLPFSLNTAVNSQ